MYVSFASKEKRTVNKYQTLVNDAHATFLGKKVLMSVIYFEIHVKNQDESMYG